MPSHRQRALPERTCLCGEVFQPLARSSKTCSAGCADEARRAYAREYDAKRRRAAQAAQRTTQG